MQIAQAFFGLISALALVIDDVKEEDNGGDFDDIKQAKVVRIECCTADHEVINRE